MGKQYGTSLNIDTFEFLTDDAQILGQATDMRITTTPGTYFEEPLYGLDTTQLLGEAFDAGKTARLGSRIAAEITEDERIAGAVVTFEKGGKFMIATTPNEGPFEFTGELADVREALSRIDPDGDA